jgi:hypothetical protein
LGPVLGREKLRSLGGGTTPTAGAASGGEKFVLKMEEGSNDEGVKEARWTFWKNVSSSRRESSDEEASVGDEESTPLMVCASPPTIAPILVREPVELI